VLTKINIKNKKIVHISFSRYGGAGISAWRLHQALIKSGYNSWFLSADNAKNIDSTLNWVVINETISFRVLKFIRRRILDYKRFYFTENVRKELSFLRKEKFIEAATLPFSYYDVSKSKLVNEADIINLHWISKIIDYESFFKECKVPIVWTMHDMNPILGIFHYQNEMLKHSCEFNQLDEKIKLFKKRYYIEHNKNISVAAPSIWLYNEIIKSNLFDLSKINYIPYSIPLNIFKPVDKKSLRENLNFSKDEIIILFIADKLNVYRKGFDLLLEAFDLIDLENVRMVAIGDTPTKVQSNHKIYYTGHINSEKKLAEYYSCADIFIIPSREEALGNTMIESLSCGTPVIGFAIGGIVDQIVNDITGYLVNETSAEALAKAILYLINNLETFDRNVIREYACEKFSDKKQVESYKKIYLELIK
jgi:glycosyltransferase involved in cell wall biosynthesis